MAPPKAKDRTVKLLPVDWHGDKPPPPPDWLIKGIIVKQGIGILSGRWGTGKTYVGVDAALSVVTGADFAGKPVKEKCGVLYLAYERGHTILRRFDTAIKARGQSSKKLPFGVMRKNLPKLLDAGAYETLEATVRAHKLEMQRSHGVRLGLIVIDTLMVAAGWENENNNAVQVLRRLSERVGIFVLAIDHHGKDPTRGARGGSDKGSSTDLVIDLTLDRAASGKMVISKVSEGAEDKFGFELKLHEIGKDEDGEPITERSVEWTSARKEKLPKTLAKAIASTGAKTIDGREMRLKSDVRNAFKKASGKKSGTFRQAWSRELTAALKSGSLVEFEHEEEVHLIAP